MTREDIIRPKHLRPPLASFARAASIFTYTFLYLPIVILIVFSFSDSNILGVWGGFSLRWYRALFADHGTVQAFLTSLRVGCISAVAATLIAGLFAFAQMRFQLNRIWERTAQSSLLAIMISPEIINGLSLLVCFGMLGLSLGEGTLYLAHTMLNLPMAWLILISRMKSIPKEWEEAAMDLGAPFWTAVKKVTLPLLAPALISSFLATFSYSFDDFVTSLFVAGPGSTTVPIKAYSMLRYSPTPEINALSTVLFIVPLTLVGISGILMWRGSKSRA